MQRKKTPSEEAIASWPKQEMVVAGTSLMAIDTGHSYEIKMSGSPQKRKDMISDFFRDQRRTSKLS